MFQQSDVTCARALDCDDDVCHLPQTYRFDLEIEARPVNMFERERAEDSERMDFRTHFLKMHSRREA